MKKVLLSVLALLLIFSLAACGTSGNTGGKKIGSVVYKFEDTFMSSMRDAMTNQAKDKGWEIDIQNAEGAQPKENDIVNSFVTQGVDVLAINPVERDLVAPVFTAAKDANIPLVFFNKQPEPEYIENSGYDKVYYVGANANESGTMMGEILRDWFKANMATADKNGDGKIQYVMMTGEMNHQDAIGRSLYSQKVLQEAGLITGFDMNSWTQSTGANECMLANDTANWNTGEATDKMNTWITSIGLDKIEAVICSNDDMALGVIEALKSAGYNAGDKDKYIPVVAVDATTKGKAALKDGTLLGTVLNDGLNQGRAVINLSIALVEGDLSEAKVGYKLYDKDGNVNENGRYIWIPYVKVTLDNVDEV